MVDLRRTPSVQHAVALISDTVTDTRRNLELLDAAIFNTILRQRVLVGDFKDAALEWVDLREIHAGTLDSPSPSRPPIHHALKAQLAPV